MRPPRWIRPLIGAAVAGISALGLSVGPALAQEPTPPVVPTKPAAGKPGKKETPPPLPPIEARVWLVAPSPQEAWTLRIDNEGATPLRIPADVRLLRFEVERTDAKNPKRKKKIKCRAPEALHPGGFPEKRALLLAPGESYVETFNPYLFCFGKDAEAIAGASLVKTTFGWDPPPKGSKKPPEAPFAAQGTVHPPSHQAARQLDAPTIMLSFAPSKPRALEPEEGATTAKPPEAKEPKEGEPAKPPAPKEPEGTKTPEVGSGRSPSGQDVGSGRSPSGRDVGSGRSPSGRDVGPEIVDEMAPRLAITSDAFADAARPRRATVTVTAKNVGHRPMLAALRPKMLSFRIEGPDKTVICAAAPATHALPREVYKTIKPEGSTSFTVILAEVCPQDTFRRAGLYRVTPTLHAEESGKELGLVAYTAEVTGAAPTLVRVHASEDPYHRDPPKAVSTAKLDAAEEPPAN